MYASVNQWSYGGGMSAMECLRDRKTTCKSSEMGGTRWDSYWVPVEGHTDYFIHFTNGMNEFVEKMTLK